jgi:putative endonuclease
MNLPEGLKRVECPEPVEGLCWVYILLMRNGMFYVGQSYDVSKRLKRHADGTGARQTKQLKEFVLVYTEGPLGHPAAISRERQLKKWTRAKLKWPRKTGQLSKL